MCLPSPSPACHSPVTVPALQSIKWSWGPRRPWVRHAQPSGAPLWAEGPKGHMVLQEQNEQNVPNMLSQCHLLVDHELLLRRGL